MRHDKKNGQSFAVKLLTPDGERSIAVAEDEHLWDAASRHGITLPALCHEGWCLTCCGRMEGAGEVDQSDSLAYFPQDREARYVLLCTGRACCNLIIRTEQATEMRRHRLRHHLPAPYSQGLKP